MYHININYAEYHNVATIFCKVLVNYPHNYGVEIRYGAFNMRITSQGKDQNSEL